ncbi:hypothetical protein H3V53_41965 [Paraburkholderia bengalensis]|uniref:Uncharacterized protein n=1 Tax=Paraburkholderia bengalensis TaxID=2747562 RepID=A0ABU8J5Y9_9BURK
MSIFNRDHVVSDVPSVYISPLIAWIIQIHAIRAENRRMELGIFFVQQRCKPLFCIAKPEIDLFLSGQLLRQPDHWRAYVDEFLLLAPVQH